MTNFALTGIAGYVAPRHLVAIRDTGNKLIASFDPHDSVGILDSYFPASNYFSNEDIFQRYLSARNISAPSDEKIHFMSICTPNHLHYSQIIMALNLGLNVICEKPLVLHCEDIIRLEEIETATQQKIYPIMQLRFHPTILKLRKNLVHTNNQNKHHHVRLTYVTRRGNWYHSSWKGDNRKSGGLALAIGIHFFDILTWLFGRAKENYLHLQEANRMAGFMEMENASVEWFLSIDEADLPKPALNKNKSAFRLMEVNNVSYDFSNGFDGLHTLNYQKILEGNGFRPSDTFPSIEIIEQLGKTGISQKGSLHKVVKLIKKGKNGSEITF